MLPDIKYFPVNWVDGMKISSQDFIAMENALFDGIRDAQAIQLNEYRYGLLPTSNPEVDNYPKLTFDYNNGVLLLKECRAVTPGGYRIEITENNYERKRYPAQLPALPISLQENGRFDVYILINPDARVGGGEFASNNPPRYKSALPKYEISIRKQDGAYIEQENFLKISEIEIREGRVDILTNTGKYIPACTSINAFSSLKRLHRNGEERLKMLIEHHVNLIKRIGIENRNEITAEAIKLSENIVTPIISTLNYYRYILPTYSPVFTVVYFKDLLRQIRFYLDRPYRVDLINQYKSDLLTYLVSVEKSEPRHEAILPVFDQIIFLLDELKTFMDELSRYDYSKQPFIVEDHNKQPSTTGYHNRPAPNHVHYAVEVDPVHEKPNPQPIYNGKSSSERRF